MTKRDEALWAQLRPDDIDSAIKMAMIHSARLAAEQHRLDAAGAASADGLPIEETTDTVTPAGRIRTVRRRRRTFHKPLTDALRLLGDLMQVRHQIGGHSDPAEIARLQKEFLDQTEEIFDVPPPAAAKV